MDAYWEIPTPFNIFFISETHELGVVIEALGHVVLVGLDAEWRPLGSRYGSEANRTQPRVSILQIACRFRQSSMEYIKEIFFEFFHREIELTTVNSKNELEIVFILDLLQLPSDSLFSLIKSLFRNPNILKLGFSFADDMRHLSSTFIHENHLECFELVYPYIDIGNMFHKVYFTEILKESTDKGKKFNGGLSSIAKRTLGLALDKKEQCSDWEMRPLSPSQIKYAAADACCLFFIFQHLCFRAELQLYSELEKKWKEKSFVGIAQVLDVYFKQKEGKKCKGLIKRSFEDLNFHHSCKGSFYHRRADFDDLTKPFLSSPQYMHHLTHYSNKSQTQNQSQFSEETFSIDRKRRDVVSDNNNGNTSVECLNDDHVLLNTRDDDDDDRCNFFKDLSFDYDADWIRVVWSYGKTIDLKEDAENNAKKKKKKKERTTLRGKETNHGREKESRKEKKEKRAGSGNVESNKSVVVSITNNFNSFDGIPPWDVSIGGDGIPKFLCDVMVEGLARHLRCVGVDAKSLKEKKNTARDLFCIIEKENRVLLTRDSKLLISKVIPSNYTFKVANMNKQQQLEEIVSAFDIRITEGMLMSRCVKCNGKILANPLTVSDALEVCSSSSQPLPLCVQKNVQIFWKCVSCSHLYWEGSQFDRAVKQFSTLCKETENALPPLAAEAQNAEIKIAQLIDEIETSNDENKLTPLDLWKIPRMKKNLEQGNDSTIQQSWLCDCNKKKSPNDRSE